MAKSAGEGDARKEAEARLAEANETLAKAQQAAAEANSGLRAAVTQNVPEMLVEVLPGNHVSHNDKSYYGVGYTFAPEGHDTADTLTLDGPTALALMQMGHVTIKGTA